MTSDEEVVGSEVNAAPELTPETNGTESAGASGLKLPIDEFREEIIQRINNNRITIIQGDTGCGKSSRLPVMLLNAPSPNPNQKKMKLFISQPRRIAAKALVERLRNVEPDLKDQIALRMGHGVREYENKQTRAWFVTTGYLVRLLANNPERFDDISVLIIDEVHERSVDTDILCLLCRRLLNTNKNIRLVLMSATLSADMYQEYFDVPDPPIKVGARRFPVKEVFLDDLISKGNEVELSTIATRKAKELSNECLKLKCKTPPTAQYMEKAYLVVSNLATTIGKPGTSVLIFVPGMNEIVAITELVEEIDVPDIRFTCVPIHSDIPFEDQMLVFNASEEDEVKIIIATNAAESSLTLPEVDNVICLGLCKQIVYNKASHRQMLTPTWISRASATQRAGRTGRVRPGTVYRLYSRESYESHMDPFEPGEMLRIPLDSVILMLKEILPEEKVSEVLLTCLEPPDISAIDRSFKSLHESHFLSTADDTCELTKLGSFVSALGIDLKLGSLIGLGIQMGLGAEAIEMAAILSFPKSPWIMSNPMVHSTDSFNKNTCRSYVSKCHFDANLFSEPLAIMNLLWEYDNLDRQQVERWGRFQNIFLPRIRRLSSTVTNLRKRVADFLGVFDDLLKVSKPPSQMPHGMTTLLRVIQVWVFHETIIQFDSKSIKKLQQKHSEDGVSIEAQPKSGKIEQNHIEQVLMQDRHKFELSLTNEIYQKGDFEYISTGKHTPTGKSSESFVVQLKLRIISYATEKKFKFACVCFQDSLMIFTVLKSKTEDAVVNCMEGKRKADSKVVVNAVSNEGKSSRGIGGRACGSWVVEQTGEENKGGRKGKVESKRGSNNKSVSWTLMYFSIPSSKKLKKKALTKNEKKNLNSEKKELEAITDSIIKLGSTGDHKGIILHFPWMGDTIRPNTKFKFNLISFGTISPVSPVDMKDFLGSKLNSTTKHAAAKQKVRFPICSSRPREFNKGKGSGTAKSSSSWDRSLINCIPEGARVLSVLISKRRENIIKFTTTSEEEEEDGERDEGTDLSISWESSSSATRRWKRYNSNYPVFVNADSVPASVVPMGSSDNLYCICANTLEVKGGSIFAEGLTLLPQGKVFVLLARFTFGLSFDKTSFEDGAVTKKALDWIGGQFGKAKKKEMDLRIEKAIAFHHSAMNLGESLECFPQKITELLEIFDGIDGYEAHPWKYLHSNPLIKKNFARHLQKGRQPTGRVSSATTSKKQKKTSNVKAKDQKKTKVTEERDFQKKANTAEGSKNKKQKKNSNPKVKEEHLKAEVSKETHSQSKTNKTNDGKKKNSTDETNVSKKQKKKPNEKEIEVVKTIVTDETTTSKKQKKKTNAKAEENNVEEEATTSKNQKKNTNAKARDHKRANSAGKVSPEHKTNKMGDVNDSNVDEDKSNSKKQKKKATAKGKDNKKVDLTKDISNETMTNKSKDAKDIDVDEEKGTSKKQKKKNNSKAKEDHKKSESTKNTKNSKINDVENDSAVEEKNNGKKSKKKSNAKAKGDQEKVDPTETVSKSKKINDVKTNDVNGEKSTSKKQKKKSDAVPPGSNTNKNNKAKKNNTEEEKSTTKKSKKKNNAKVKGDQKKAESTEKVSHEKMANIADNVNEEKSTRKKEKKKTNVKTKEDLRKDLSEIDTLGPKTNKVNDLNNDDADKEKSNSKIPKNKTIDITKKDDKIKSTVVASLQLDKNETDSSNNKNTTEETTTTKKSNTERKEDHSP